MCCLERQRKLWTDSLICIRSKLQVRLFHSFLKLSWSQGCPLEKKNWGNIHKWTVLASIKMFENKNHRPRVKVRGWNLCLSECEIGEKSKIPEVQILLFQNTHFRSLQRAGQKIRWTLLCVCIESWKTLVCAEGSQGKPASGASAFAVSSVWSRPWLSAVVQVQGLEGQENKFKLEPTPFGGGSFENLTSTGRVPLKRHRIRLGW